MDIQSVAKSLDGASLRHLTDQWVGIIDGIVGIENVEKFEDSIRFEIVLPTKSSDVGDFIWRSERASGTTDKIELQQAGIPVPGATVVGVDREGAAADWTPSAQEQYRITVDVPIASIDSDVPLGLLIRWPAGPTAQAVATAVGRLR